MFRLIAALLALCLALPAQAASVDDHAIASHVTGDGPTIIFIHGYTCDETVWDASIAHFAENYRVVTLDLPGHGESDVPPVEAFSMKLFARAVEAVREEVGAEKVVLVGHSMGGVIIRQYAVMYPDRVAGLVAVDGVMDPRELASYPQEVEVTSQMRASMVEFFFSDATTEPLRNEIRNMMLNTSSVTATGAMNAMIDPTIRTADVVSAPAYNIVAGSSKTKDEAAHSQVFSDWSQVQVEGTGHFLMMEKPEAFNALLDTFLTERAAW